MKITFKKDDETINSLESWEKNGGPKYNKQWKKGYSAYEMAHYATNHTYEFVKKTQSVLKSCGLQQQDFVCEPEATIGLGQGIKDFPLPLINDDIKIRLESLVSEILEAKNIDSNADTISLEQKIDLIVYKSYDLTYDEVKIVDSETPITKEEYERGQE